MKVLAGCTAAAMAVAVTAVPALQAAAAPVNPVTAIRLSAHASGTGPGQSVSATVSPSWQTNGTVWAITSAHGVVYVGGGFTSVRPPGDPLGTGEVARTGLAAFNASTGALITTFDPVMTGIPACSSNTPCGITALAVSPDGSTLYVGGSFTGVNGSYRGYLAAFSTSSGALLAWKPAATGPVHAIAVSPDGSTVYAGGDFTKLDGQARTKAGAVSAATGALLAWAPALNGSVTSIAVAPDDSRVLVGGYFTTFNGVTQQSIGSTNPTTGASATWVLPANFIPDNAPGCVSDVKDVIINGGTAYIADEGTGAGCFDGDFAVHFSDGSLVWQSDCLGATQALVIINGLLYKGSHAHDCAYAPGGFPQVPNPVGKGWVVHRLLTQSLADGSVGHWTPNTNGNQLGPRVMATDGSQLFLGGDFSTVNQQPQQGFARFAPTPDTTTPGRPGAPTVTSTSAGVDSVTFTAVSDTDDGTLSYAIYRDGGKSPIATISATSWPWAPPVLHYRDSGLVPGSKHTYTVSASDGVHTSSQSIASAQVTVSSTSPPRTYWQTVLGDHPSFLWKLGDSGSTAADSSPNGFTGIYESGTTHGAAGPITGDPTTATSFDGNAGLVTSAKAVAGPQNFSIEGWFKTTTNTGGKLIGFGTSQTGMSATYDRSIYLMNDGQLVFGVYSGGVQTVESPRVYNDGHWHYVVATIGSGGMALYVDGQLIGTNPTKTAQNYTGYWRVGGDNLKGAWNLDYWKTNSQGTTEPYGYYVSGIIADVAVYPAVLTAAQVAAHYAANALSH